MLYDKLIVITIDQQLHFVLEAETADRRSWRKTVNSFRVERLQPNGQCSANMTLSQND